MKDNNVVPNDPLHKLIEKQAKSFEEFGKKLSSDLQASLNEHLVQQGENGFENSMNTLVELEKTCEKYEKKIEIQSQLIDSLKARVEELETDSIIKTQDIKKIQEEFNDFKKEIHSMLFNVDVKNTLNQTESIETKLDKQQQDSENEFVVKPLEPSYRERYDVDDYEEDEEENPQNIRLHDQVLKIVNNFRKKNRDYKDKTFNCLIYMFTADEFLSYEESRLFDSLDDESKRCIGITVQHRLASEIVGKKKKLSQPIKVYVDRNLIPPLPIGIKSYAEFEKTSEFDFLSHAGKMGVKKAISVEKMN